MNKILNLWNENSNWFTATQLVANSVNNAESPRSSTSQVNANNVTLRHKKNQFIFPVHTNFFEDMGNGVHIRVSEVEKKSSAKVAIHIDDMDFLVSGRRKGFRI